MTQRTKLFLMGAVIVLFAVVIWFLVLSPIRGDIADTQQATQDEETLVVQANTRLKHAEATKGEGKNNQMRLLELAKMVPMKEELPSLLLQIQDLADQSGIEFIQVTPGEVTASQSGLFQVIPLALEFSGTYFDISDFVYRAEQMVAGPGRLLAIKTVDLALGGGSVLSAGSSPELEVSMSVYAFVFGGGTLDAVTVAPPATTGGDVGSSTAATDASTAQ
jgi:Tfp pilus assembly protein PilO